MSDELIAKWEKILGPPDPNPEGRFWTDIRTVEVISEPPAADDVEARADDPDEASSALQHERQEHLPGP